MAADDISLTTRFEPLQRNCHQRRRDLVAGVGDTENIREKKKRREGRSEGIKKRERKKEIVNGQRKREGK